MYDNSPCRTPYEAMDYRNVLADELKRMREARDRQVRQWRGLALEEYNPDD